MRYPEAASIALAIESGVEATKVAAQMKAYVDAMLKTTSASDVARGVVNMMALPLSATKKLFTASPTIVCLRMLVLFASVAYKSRSAEDAVRIMRATQYGMMWCFNDLGIVQVALHAAGTSGQAAVAATLLPVGMAAASKRAVMFAASTISLPKIVSEASTVEYFSKLFGASIVGTAAVALPSIGILINSATDTVKKALESTQVSVFTKAFETLDAEVKSIDRGADSQGVKIVLNQDLTKLRSMSIASSVRSAIGTLRKVASRTFDGEVLPFPPGNMYHHHLTRGPR